MERPEFLTRRYENGADLIAAFNESEISTRQAVDKWIMAYGPRYGLTWQEDCLEHYLCTLEEL